MGKDNPGRGDPMTADRRLRLWAVLVDAARGGAVAVDHVCAAAVSVAGVDSVAIAVILDATPRELVYATDRTASELEDLTLTLGEGPCVDATTGGPVLVADLTAPECRNRWPVFAPAAVLAGAGVQGGIAYGRSDKDAAYPVDHPVSPEDLAATVFHALGISPDTRVLDPLGRPVPVMEGGKPLVELLG